MNSSCIRCQSLVPSDIGSDEPSQAPVVTSAATSFGPSGVTKLAVFTQHSMRYLTPGDTRTICLTPPWRVFVPGPKNSTFNDRVPRWDPRESIEGGAYSLRANPKSNCANFFCTSESNPPFQITASFSFSRTIERH